MNLWGQNEQNCGLVQDSCDFSSLQCGDSTMTNPPVPFPGAWLVMKSLGNIHRVSFVCTEVGAGLTGW